MTQAQENRTKYLKAPTVQQIKDFIKELGVSDAQFERFFGIPAKTIGEVYMGKRDLPAKFWHYIYLKQKPAYGVGYVNTGKAQIPSTKISIKKKQNITSIGAERLASLLKKPS